MKALVVLVAGLGAAGFLPAVAVARRSPALIFLAPLIGAGLAAVAAEIELAMGGSLWACYLALTVAVNVAVVAWWRTAGRFSSWSAPPLDWSVVTMVAVLAALSIPLLTLRAPLFGWDAEQIWLTHAMMISGGHHEMLTSLQNPAYWSGNPDYPPLVPAAGALAFAFFGMGDLHIAVDMTVLLNACALAVVGVGVATVGSRGRRATRIAAAAAGAAVGLAGFAVSGSYGINGYADLLWAAAAVAAIIWGLVLPRSGQALGIAWICAAVASLTKNEGLTTALIVLVLIAFRYRPVTLRRVRHTGGQPEHRRPAGGAWQAARTWAERAAHVVLPALPGLTWAGLARLIGLTDRFLSSSSPQSLAARAGATLHGMAVHLTVAPVAIAVLVAGCCLLRRDRADAALGNPGWLWAACLGSLVVIFTTYLLGPLQIHIWLKTSVDRTTIFAQLLLYAELALWLVIALDAVSAGKTSEPGSGPPAEVSAAGSGLRLPA